MKKLVIIAVAALMILFLALTIRTFRFPSRQVHPPVAVSPPVDSKVLAEHLAESLRFRTVSYRDPSQFQGEEFLRLHRYLEKVFPRVHSVLTREIAGNFSLLYTWEGQDTNLKPILLLSHIDVVPVETETRWTHPPFDGDQADGHIWGRGALDDKSGVLAILEAIELLLQEGYRPQRTIYLAFGHDEEVGGFQGAAAVATLLKSRGIRTECTLDEGGAILDGMVPGVSSPVAMVGIAEKGYLNLELTAEDVGGHSSMPPPQTVIGRLSNAIHRLEQHPFRAHLSPAMREMFSFLGPEMAFSKRFFTANLWLFAPLVTRMMEREPQSAAWLRTTTAPTIIEGGFKENVLPGKARAVVNFRILPGDSIKEVIEHVIRTIRDPQIKVKAEQPGTEPSSVADTGSESFRILQKTISEIFPNVLVSPYLLSGGTDSRHYEPVSGPIFRFLPIGLEHKDLERIHGMDERVSIENFRECVLFYRKFILNW
jgi:carboxypeptidase PM20D1